MKITYLILTSIFISSCIKTNIDDKLSKQTANLDGKVVKINFNDSTNYQNKTNFVNSFIKLDEGIPDNKWIFLEFSENEKKEISDDVVNLFSGVGDEFIVNITLLQSKFQLNEKLIYKKLTTHIHYKVSIINLSKNEENQNYYGDFNISEGINIEHLNNHDLYNFYKKYMNNVLFDAIFSKRNINDFVSK